LAKDKDVGSKVEELVEACEATYGFTPHRIVVAPNGKVEVNARIFRYRDRDPEMIYRRRA
jgi:hypothetical protein